MKRTILGLLAVVLGSLSSQAVAYTYVWTVDKSVDRPDVTLSWGESTDVTWTVSYTFALMGDPFGGNIDDCIVASDPRFGFTREICGQNATFTFPEEVGPYFYAGDEYLEDVIVNYAYFTLRDQTYSDSATVRVFVSGTPVPEPGTLALLGLGLAGLGLSRRRKIA